MKKVLITDPLSATGIKILKDAGIEVIQLLDGQKDDLMTTLPDIDGWIIRSGTQVGLDEISKAKKLKAIGRAGVGVDNIDIQAATAHGVVVMNTPDGNTISAAEHTIALIMSLARKIPEGDATMKAGTWARKTLKGTELNGKILGVIGLGRIGQEVAKRALGLQMSVIGYDPYVSQEQLLVKDIQTVTLDELLELADVITLHLPKNKDTIDLIGTPELKKMKDSAMLVNCARGGLVNEADLGEALRAGTIAGAALDVYTIEPPEGGNPLTSAPNMVLTPHLGASTFEAGENVAVQIATQLRDYLLNEKLSNTINLPISDMSILKAIKPSLELAKELGKLQHPLHSAAIKSIRVSYNGDPEHIKPILYSAFEGIMEHRFDSTINLINARAVAESKSISLSTLHDPELSHVQNVISVRVESKDQAVWELMGYTDLQGNHRLIRVNKYHVDVLLKGHFIMILNKDVPGVVGVVGTLLADHNINIAEYSLTRLEGDHALSLIKCDSTPSDNVKVELKKISSIKACYFLG